MREPIQLTLDEINADGPYVDNPYVAYRVEDVSYVLVDTKEEGETVPLKQGLLIGPYVEIVDLEYGIVEEVRNTKKYGIYAPVILDKKQ